jgi:hypothetical protein
MDVWYEENDRVLSPVRGPPQTSRSKRTCLPLSLNTTRKNSLGEFVSLRRYHGIKKDLPGVRSVCARFRRMMNEVSLRRDRQIRMGVEHEPEQRSSRTPCPDDEGRWG